MPCACWPFSYLPHVKHSFWAQENPRKLEANPSRSINKSGLLISKNSKDVSQSQRCCSLVPCLLCSAIISLEINPKCYLRGSFDVFFMQALKKNDKVGGWPVAADGLIIECSWNNHCLITRESEICISSACSHPVVEQCSLWGIDLPDSMIYNYSKRQCQILLSITRAL